jgi:hypothetical protein
MLFSHSGRIGDVLYSLYFCKAWRGTFDLHLVTNQSDPPTYFKEKPIRISDKDLEFILPLFEYQSYINKVTAGEEKPDDAYTLDLFRTHSNICSLKDIRDWYFCLTCRVTQHPYPFANKAEAILELPDVTENIDKIAICFTDRYKAVCNLSVLEPIKDKLVFIGLESEWKNFCTSYFPVEFEKFNTMLDMAVFMKSCRGFIGNVSGTYAIVECAHIRRVQCQQADGGNVPIYDSTGIRTQNSDVLLQCAKNMLLM